LFSEEILLLFTKSIISHHFFNDFNLREFQPKFAKIHKVEAISLIAIFPAILSSHP
jgi:hypothetical protein